MAYWFRKTGTNHVYVIYRKDGRNVPLPRKKTKHLDGDEDHNIDAFTNQIALKYEGSLRKVTPENVVGSDTELGQYVQAYLDYLTSRGKSEFTVQHQESVLHRFVLPFFLEGEQPLRDPAQWPGRSIRLLSWLQGKGLPVSTIQLCNTALRGLYQYLTEEGRIQTGIELRLRNPLVQLGGTRLPRLVLPEEVLAYARRTTDPALKLTALLGYFASLRPQETFALRKADFIGGSKAEELECCKAMRAAGLYSRLAVKVHRQRSVNGKYSAPKAYSAGYVALFNEAAAREVVEILRGIEDPLAPLFPCLPGWHSKLWAKSGIEGITTKDLRRASLYHLAHKTELKDLISVMKHARHKNPETTMLYLRRPGEDVGGFQELDLDA